MSYYPSLLGAIFAHFKKVQDRNPLLITHELIPAAEESGRGTEIKVLVPPESKNHRLDGGESFVDAALKIAAEHPTDCMFIHPPFLGHLRLSSEWRQKYGALGIEEATIDSILDATAPNNAASTMVVLLPAHLLSSLRSAAWRDKIFSNHEILVIEHEHDGGEILSGAGPQVMFQLVTLVIQRRRGPTRFAKLTESALSETPENVAKEILRLLRQPGGATKYGYVHSGDLAPGIPCRYDSYSRETRSLKDEVKALGERVTLGDVSDILLGCIPASPNRREASRPVENCLSLAGAAISTDGTINLDQATISERPIIVRNFLEEGDYCIPTIGRRDGSLVVGVYVSDGRQMTFGSSIIVARPKPAITPGQRAVLLAFLRSPLAQRLLKLASLSTLGGRFRITPHDLRGFPVPLADGELVTALAQLAEARAAFSSWIGMIDSDSNAVVQEANAATSRMRILTAGQLARQRYRAAHQVESLEFRIQTQFPHPLAYVWREQLVSDRDPVFRLRAIRKAAESHTSFLAFIAIILARAVGVGLKSVAFTAEQLTKRKGGTSFGNWLEIIREVTSNKDLKGMPATPFAQLLDFNADGEWEKAVRALMAIRNNDSHERLSAVAMKTAVEDAARCLAIIYRATEFLTDYRLVLVTRTKVDSIRKLTTYSYRDLSGDHPLALLCEGKATEVGLEEGSLYLQDRDGGLHLLRPLLQYLECPECHQMSTFYLDTYKGGANGNTVVIKSIERSSTREEEGAEEFKHVGLLL